MTKCFVKTCRTSNKRHLEGVTMHKIPYKMKKEWLEAIKRPKNTLVNQQRICSLHFTENDVEKIGVRKRIKEGVVPSQLLPTESPLASPLPEPKWTTPQIETLIKEYKKYPVLYTADAEVPLSPEKRAVLLDAIVKGVQGVRPGVTEPDVVQQWIKLRNKYSEIHAKFIAGSELPEMSAWLYKQFEFLNQDPFLHDANNSELEMRVTWENTPATDPLSTTEASVKEEVLETDEAPQKRLRLADYGMEDHSYSQPVSSTPKDESDIFGAFVASQLKKITREDVRQDVIFEIHQTLHGALKRK